MGFFRIFRRKGNFTSGEAEEAEERRERSFFNGNGGSITSQVASAIRFVIAHIQSCLNTIYRPSPSTKKKANQLMNALLLVILLIHLLLTCRSVFFIYLLNGEPHQISMPSLLEGKLGPWSSCQLTVLTCLGPRPGG